MRNFAAVTAAAITAAILIAAAAPADAKNKLHRNNASRQQAWNGTQNPWSMPNCFIWSPQHRYWVWICGEPYPDEMPHR